MDNKGSIFCCLYAMKALADLGYKFPVKVKIIFGTNEETGMEDMKWYFKDHAYPMLGWTPDCKYPVIYAERGRAVFRYSVFKEHLKELMDFMNQYILNQSDLAVSLGIDYSDEEFGKNQVRKTELFQNEKECGITLVSGYPASYDLQMMEEALRKLCSEHMTLEIHRDLPIDVQEDI